MVIGAVASPRIRERRQRAAAEQAGITISQMLQHIVAGAPLGVVVVDTHRDVVFMNDRASQLGLVRDRLLDDRAWVAAQRTLMTGESREVDLSQRKARPTGRSALSVRGHVRLLTEEDRRFAVLYVDDQSEHARMEATRRDFVANVSHELKTPVGAMGVLGRGAAGSPPTTPTPSAGSGPRCSPSPTGWPTWSASSSSCPGCKAPRRLPDLGAVDIDTVVAEAISRNKVAADNADIDVTTDAPSGFRVLGDQTLLVTALANLISNAHRVLTARVGGVDQPAALRGEHRDRGHRPWISASPALTRSGCSSGSSGSTRHVRAPPAAPDSGWRSSSTSRPITTGRSGCGVRPGTGSTFTLSIPAYPDPSGDPDVDVYAEPAAHIPQKPQIPEIPTSVTGPHGEEQRSR